MQPALRLPTLRHRPRRGLPRLGRWVAGLLLLAACPSAAAAPAAAAGSFGQDVAHMAALGDRRPGSAGNQAAAEFIRQRLERLGLEEVGGFRFDLPVAQQTASFIALGPPSGERLPVFPFLANVVSPGTIPPEGLHGPLIYVGRGELSDFNGQDPKDALILMELDSGRNWIHAANLGARAVIFLDRGASRRALYHDKQELTPIAFPLMWISRETLPAHLGPLDAAPAPLATEATLTSDVHWETVVGQNVFGVVPGRHPELARQLLIVQAFYDSSAYVAGHAPGADEATGIATLLELAQGLVQQPPERSVLLLATDAHSQGLAGMREAMWALNANSKYFITRRQALTNRLKQAKTILDTLALEALQVADPDPLLMTALGQALKTAEDQIARQLMRLRLKDRAAEGAAAIQRLAAQRQVLRQMGWKPDLQVIDAAERAWIERLIPVIREEYQRIRSEAQRQLSHLKQALTFRRIVRERELAAVASLHLSSRGDGLGAFQQGFLYQLKPEAVSGRIPAYSLVDEILHQAAARHAETTGRADLFKDSLRPNRRKPWESYLPDQPALGGEVSALAGFLGFTLATTHDERTFWGTPADTPARMDAAFAAAQSRLVAVLIRALAAAPGLHEDRFPRDGLSMVGGTAKFIRHGELFAEQPAPGTILTAFQGPAVYHVQVDQAGEFALKGVSDKKNVFDKVIFEGYRFDPRTGEVIWAIDKKKTGKDRYRVKMQRREMETDLIMFACRQTTLFDLLEPRDFRYLTKITLLDARSGAMPLNYWWSRIDTRDSTLLSLYLEPETRFKLTLSDTVLRTKLILTGAAARNPEGVGYLVDQWPRLYHTEYRVARDMWQLIAPRIQNLEAKGIHDEQLRALQTEGQEALQAAESALAANAYDRFLEAARRSWALASRVYDQVESTQKDILFGVLFYIALFVPFAFCAERLLFGYHDIHKRIVAFLALLLLLIAVVYNVHPAFDLAYSPTVVILAFFIIGLSLIVTLIIFFRFEAEMSRLQHRAAHRRIEGISRWKAFTAAFILGVTNLKRRRLRSALTCTTLIILTFTIMSFTAVKSTRLHSRIFFQDAAPYQGFLIKTADWGDLPTTALDALTRTFLGRTQAAPRVWQDTENRTQTPKIPVYHGDRQFEVQGIVGLAAAEPQFTGIGGCLLDGEWFQHDDGLTVVIPRHMADQLGIGPGDVPGATVRINGTAYRVAGILDEQCLERKTDLDGEPLTPVSFPNEVSAELSEVEMEALESGDDVRNFQSRYQHTAASLVLYMPYRTLLNAGGRLKGVALTAEPHDPAQARHLADRFGLVLFAGEPQGTFMYHSSDTIQYSGVPNIFIPLAISVFIVLNTMISSVYERQREIGIYTSVGLAPSHVSFLFIAEALAFAVLSVVLGYITAQTTARLFADTALWRGITVNYSSLAGVAAMLLVILVVLISVVYPSRVAANIAIPDVNRSWKMPAPQQNQMTLTLPFLIKADEQQSLAGFLLEHFTGHQDVSHGLFSTGELSLSRLPASDGTGQYELKARVWLAPFDFGIMQQVRLQFLPAAEEPGFFELRLELQRESGEVNTWGRVNRGFVNDLRKQLLIWRSLDAWTVERYAQSLAPGDTASQRSRSAAAERTAGESEPH